jgi:hypothetical protein
MRKTTVRLSDRLWELVQGEARREGVTGAQYIREAVIARVFYDQGLRGAAFGETAVASERASERDAAARAASEPAEPPPPGSGAAPAD